MAAGPGNIASSVAIGFVMLSFPVYCFAGPVENKSFVDPKRVKLNLTSSPSIGKSY